MTLYKDKAYFEFFDKNGIKLTESCYFFDEASISNNVSYNNAEISGKKHMFIIMQPYAMVQKFQIIPKSQIVKFPDVFLSQIYS